MNKKRGILIIVFLVLILGVVNAAWAIYYKKTITTNVIGDKKIYDISQEFNSLSLNTSGGPDSDVTLMKIGGLSEDENMNYAIETRKTYLDASCPNPDKDCLVTVTQIYAGGSGEIRNILSSTQNINSEKNFTLVKNTDNLIEYKVECIKNSCPQRISSNVTIQQV
jgi:hypothetical protein